jgi:hypothetical protein
MRKPSETNAAAVARSYHPARPDERVDWNCCLYDSAGYEHVLIDLGAVQLVTKLHSCYVIWDRRTLKCVSHQDDDLVIRNTPLTDVEKHQQHVLAREALRTMYPADDPRRQELERSALRDRGQAG